MSLNEVNLNKDHIIKTHNLTKRYKNQTAVDSLNITVGKGEIYGFLGQNGAGKTTTIRMLLGLARPTSGEIELFGKSIKYGSYDHYRRIGFVLENPGFYPNLTAVENLEINKRMMGLKSEDSIKNVLDMVGLPDTGKKPVKKFSMGMKQRLGIARALLHNPELLILDEPINGLDPIGIKEIRQLIQDLSTQKNVTIFVSSHILSEIQNLTSKIGIIHMGRLLKEIDLEAINKEYANKSSSSFLEDYYIELIGGGLK